MKNTENTRFKDQEQFSENIKIVFFVFSKTVLENSLPLVSCFLKLLLETFFENIENTNLKTVLVI